MHYKSLVLNTMSEIEGINENKIIEKKERPRRLSQALIPI